MCSLLPVHLCCRLCRMWIHSAHTQYLNIGAICRWCVHVMLLLQHLKLKPQVVNGNGVLSSKVLGDAYKGEGKVVRQWEAELCTMQVRTMHSLSLTQAHTHTRTRTHTHTHTHTHCLSMSIDTHNGLILRISTLANVLVWFAGIMGTYQS